MLHISAGLQKSGTAWYFRLANAILVRAGCRDVQTMCRQVRLTPAGRATNGNVGALSARHLAQWLRPSLAGKPCLAKTRAAPTASARLLLRLRLVQATYIFRDPRDAALSVFERGNQARTRGETSPFARYATLEQAIDFVAEQLPIWAVWTVCPQVFITDYEARLADPATVLADLLHFWSVQVPAGASAEVVAAYDVQRIAGLLIGSHIPKCAGSSMKQVMRRFFGRQLRRTVIDCHLEPQVHPLATQYPKLDRRDLRRVFSAPPHAPRALMAKVQPRLRCLAQRLFRQPRRP